MFISNSGFYLDKHSFKSMHGEGTMGVVCRHAEVFHIIVSIDMGRGGMNG